MIFSTPLFLFLFLPVVLTLYFLFRRELRNIVLLLASVLFYAWANVPNVVVLIASILFNHLAAIIIEQTREKKRLKLSNIIFVIGVAVNILLLAMFKYASFFVGNINVLLMRFQFTPFAVPDILLPLGISFFTFKAISYLVDVSRCKTEAQYSLVKTGLYIAMFPQLVAGPISRYRDLAEQITSRDITLQKFSRGIERFIYGLAKKVLIANTLASVADQIFSISPDHLNFSVAWFGAVCYTLQIFFDFSGYTDMAIGVGLMLGFTFVENFNYPYIAKSITEFWQRWHISLSTWLRDYLFLPQAYALARKFDEKKIFGVKIDPVFWSYAVGTIVTMFIAGLWHGASWTFILWGVYFGVILILERLPLGKLLKKLPSVFRHIYALLAIIIGWVMFRSESFSHFLSLTNAMAGFSIGNPQEYPVAMYLNTEIWITLIAGVLLSMPLAGGLALKWEIIASKHIARLTPFIKYSVQIVLLLLSLMVLAGSTHIPFIYFQF